MTTDSRRPQQRYVQVAEGVRTPGKLPRPDAAFNPPSAADQRRQQVHAAETRLLYENSSTGIIASLLIALAFVSVQRHASSPPLIASWLLYVLVIAGARFAIARRYWRASPGEHESHRWKRLFVIGTALAASAWAVAGVVFYDPARSTYGVFLMFVLGGVMLGGASLLAARREAFLTFLPPIGLLTSSRLAAEGDAQHLMMAFLVLVFTAATVATAWRFQMTIASSLGLRFDNLDLIESLQIAMDHTESLNRDLELRVGERTAMLLEADQRKDEFLATLAHELRNPLAPIRFALEALKTGTATAAAARARDVIDRQVSQLVRLVDDLLDVSRITTNKMVLRREAHDVARLMATAAESILPLAKAAEHTLFVEPPETPSYVHGDSARLVQVFANVLNNAVKFTPRGGQIWFTAERLSTDVVVQIRDTGMGIAADVLPRVFDMFRQAEPILERSAGGLGIGLTLARRIVDMHEGRIEVRSPGPGRGTEVEIRLPMTMAVDVPVLAARPEGNRGTRSLRVLIVEDNLDAAEMLDTAVSQLGHATRLAHDGASAITCAGQFAPDVILLDIGLPVMNGYEVARTLRAQPEFSHVHIAAVTGWGQDEDRRKAREAGFDSHFTKPLAPAVMEDLLARAAQGRTSEDDTPSPSIAKPGT